MEEMNEVNQRLREEVDRLNQELAARGAAQALGQGAAPAPEGVPLPPDGEIDFRTRETILRSVPRFLDNGTVLYRDHEVMMSKFLLCRADVVQDRSSEEDHSTGKSSGQGCEQD